MTDFLTIADVIYYRYSIWLMKLDLFKCKIYQIIYKELMQGISSYCKYSPYSNLELFATAWEHKEIST